MIYINEKGHTSVMIGSLDKVYKQLRLTGKLKSTDIYILDAIYKLLSGCTTSISNYQRRSLILLYNQVLGSSKYACPAVILPQEQINPKSKFVQAEFLDCNNYPNSDKVYYWQESDYNIRNADLLISVLDPLFTNGKLSSTLPVFSNGILISYENVGVIGFLINNTKLSDVYKVYDANNFDVSTGFNITFIPEINSTLIVSTNVYSYGDMMFKIKKI